jgi:mono/diheme cytochrome c family protein
MKTKNHLIYIIAVTCFCILSCSSGENTNSSAQPVPATTELPAVKNGKSLFETKCASCHGADGTAGIGNAAALHASTLDSISVIRTITNGRNGMPAFKDQLTSDQLHQLASYVQSLRN